MPREHPLAPHRLIPAAIILVLAVVTLLAVKGPTWYQRFYHPLEYEKAIAERSQSHGLDPYLVAALINVESGFDAQDVSERGAVGLMQLMPETAAEVARDNGIGAKTDSASLKDPDLNIRLGTLHLTDLVGRFPSIEEALAAYNAGAGNVARWRKQAKDEGKTFSDVIPYPQTRQYIADVLRQRDDYARLYPGVFEEFAK